MTATAIANLTANLNFELTHTRIHTCVGHIPRTTCSIVQVNLSWPLARNKLFLVVSSLVNLVLQTTLIGARSFGSSFPVLAPTLVHHSCGIRILIIVELNDQLLFVGATGKTVIYLGIMFKFWSALSGSSTFADTPKILGSQPNRAYLTQLFSCVF